MLSINMLGEVNITYKGEKIVDSLSNKTVAMICLLVLNRDKNVSKEKIASYFWPDSNEEAARYNVRYNLWTIGKLIPKDAAGETLITTGKDCCGINNRYRFTCDRVMLDTYHSKGKRSINDLLRLKELFKGDFLEGMYLKNCNEFNEMILFERVICQNKQVELLDELAREYEENQRYEESLKTLQEMLAIEPYNEAFAIRVMGLYGQLGNRAAAIHFYKKFELSLRNNLGICPDQQLQEQYRFMMEDSISSIASKGNTGSKEKKLPHVMLRPMCIQQVAFFCIADMLRQMEEQEGYQDIPMVDSNTRMDLSYIYPELYTNQARQGQLSEGIPKEVPGVRIIQGFYRYLEHYGKYYDIHIVVDKNQTLDAMSEEIFRYLESRKIQNVNFIDTM